ncbi:MAG: hypothetical protein MK133_05925, partial [Planctomycetes bacterium]|nr:hypothetical protein [Planctomycetota bacterium]
MKIKTSGCRSSRGMLLVVAILCCGNGLRPVPARADEAGQKKLAIPRPAIFMWGYSDPVEHGGGGIVSAETISSGAEGIKTERHEPGGLWKKTLRTVNVVEGLTSDAKLVSGLRKEGKVFAWHVVNKIEEGD